ncbi:MAG: hypothetical protein AB7F43_12615 [Bacteriovoracia bacterium]
MKNTSKEWTNDFLEFNSASEIKPPQAVTESIFQKVEKDLNPSSWVVFSKVALIHVVVGFITLLFCPQFGISLVKGMGLMSLFLKFGETACMVSCGAIFLGGSILAATFILRTEEIKIIRRNKFLQIPILGILSFGMFICLGATTISALALAWLVGNILGGITSLELGWVVHRITYRVLRQK